MSFKMLILYPWILLYLCLVCHHPIIENMETLAVIFSEFDLLLIEKLHGPMAKLWSADSMIIGLNPSLAMIFHFLPIFVNRLIMATKVQCYQSLGGEITFLLTCLISNNKITNVRLILSLGWKRLHSKCNSKHSSEVYCWIEGLWSLCMLKNNELTQIILWNLMY